MNCLLVNGNVQKKLFCLWPKRSRGWGVTGCSHKKSENFHNAQKKTTKDLIGSMKTYARHLMKLAANVGRLVAREPEKPIPESYIADLKNRL